MKGLIINTLSRHTGTSMDSKFQHELEKIRNNESGEPTTFQVEFERNMETKLEGLRQLMSTMSRCTNEFEYYTPRCTQLQYLSTHSNQVASWKLDYTRGIR